MTDLSLKLLTREDPDDIGGLFGYEQRRNK